MKKWLPTLIAVAVLQTCLHAEVRTWTSTEGKELRAEFVSQSGGSVSVKRSDGSVIAIPLNRLSNEDQKWVRERPKAPPGDVVPANAVYSKTWGKAGEKWNPEDETLIDFSFAGYHEGKNDFPEWEVGTNVRDFGAVGDGKTDDTAAFKKAIAECGDKQAVFIPNGTYKLMDWIGVDEMIDKWVKPKSKSNYVVRGESREGVTILLGIGLEEIHPWAQTTGHGRPTSQWSWSGGFLWFQDGSEVGVENLTIKGAGGTYDSHWKERGFNAIFFRDIEHAWVRNVTLTDVDCGILVNDGKYITIENVIFTSSEDRPSSSSFEDNEGVSGHHAINFGAGSSWCVADEVVFENRFHHELGVNGETHHCVYSNCKGPNLHFDFHTHENNIPHVLFTQIDAGEGNLIWRNNFYGACTGGTFWNIKGKKLTLPKKESWVTHPMLAEEMKTLFVGWDGKLPADQEVGRPWFEKIAPESIYPQNIYHAQRTKRLGVGSEKTKD